MRVWAAICTDKIQEHFTFRCYHTFHLASGTQTNFRTEKRKLFIHNHKKLIQVQCSWSCYANHTQTSPPRRPVIVVTILNETLPPPQGDSHLIQSIVAFCLPGDILLEH